jgi:hypothetical protein
MNRQDILSEIQRSFLEEARSDVVGIWSLAKWVKEDLPLLDGVAVRQATLDVVREILLQGRVVPGDFQDRNEQIAVFVPWQLSADEALARIERDWATLGREPIAGEIVWFVDSSLLPITANKYPMGTGWEPR